ncbi:MAG: restriction endonuclease [Armatimonadaceae bacterium]
MAVPKFRDFLYPVLKILSDGTPVHLRDVERKAVELLRLTKEDQNELVASGRKSKVSDRVAWALTYLRQAKLIENVGRGVNKITARGTEYLTKADGSISPADLKLFPEFADFKSRQHDDVTDEGAIGSTLTPEEAIAQAYSELNGVLADELLERIKQMPPPFFERLIVQLMLRLGYGGTSDDSGQTLGRSGDGGVDGVINQDKLGLEKIYLQAKRWSENTVGRPEVQSFVGALTGQGATKGVFNYHNDLYP